MTGLAALLALALAAPAVAQQPAPAPRCARAEIVPGFEAWGGSTARALAIGKPATLTLGDARGVRFVPPLAREAAAGSHGGVFPLTIAAAGTYRIALSAGAWLDVVDAGGRRIPSEMHMHGPACSGIAKIVAFALPAGSYRVQLSEAKTPAITAMVAR